jgi:hypothetical protein
VFQGFDLQAMYEDLSTLEIKLKRFCSLVAAAAVVCQGFDLQAMYKDSVCSLAAAAAVL